MLLESVHQMMIYVISGVQQETLPHTKTVTLFYGSWLRNN